MRMRATQNFAYGTKTGEQWVNGGAEYDSEAPLVKAFPNLFEQISAPDPEPEKPTRRRRGNG